MALLCALFVAGAIVAYEMYLDFLVGVFVILAVVFSCLFNEARKAYRRV